MQAGSIKEKSEAGLALLATANRVLDLVRHPGATQIGLSELLDCAKIDADAAYIGDGFISPDAAGEPELEKAIAAGVDTRDFGASDAGRLTEATDAQPGTSPGRQRLGW